MFARQPTAALPPGRRIYAVGDVHGRMDLLRELTRLIAIDNAGRPDARVEIVLLGDLVDRGPNSAEVVRFGMKARPPFANLITLKGNHESVMLQAIGGDAHQMARWLQVGGAETLASYGVPEALLESDDLHAIGEAAEAAIPLVERGWLASLPLWLKVGDYLFVHAGIRPGIPLELQKEHDLLWIREDFLRSREPLPATVVHGHTPTKRVEVRRYRINIDTGAYASHRLTALGMEGDQRWLLAT